MKTIVKIALVVVSVATLISCTKTLILSNGTHNKKIKVSSSIQIKKDDFNNTIMSFESVKGTKYTINTSEYNYTIK